MQYTISNEEGEFYAGFQDGEPVWSKTPGSQTLFDEWIADAILKQMTQLGFTRLKKKIYEK